MPASRPDDPTHPHRGPRLIVVRGNSGSGKSSVARLLQHRHGRGCALVEQDHFRRKVLRERDKPGGLVAAYLQHNVAFLLDHGYHVILEGILHRAKYGPMLAELRAARPEHTHFFYLDVTFDESLRRHATRPQAAEFTPEDMRGWYLADDVLDLPGEFVVPPTSSAEDTVALIAGLPLTGHDDVVPRHAAPAPEMAAYAARDGAARREGWRR